MSKASEDTCHIKAVERGDLTFTLVGQDVTSPQVICEWIRCNIDSAPPEKLFEALSCAIAMRDLSYQRDAD